MQQCRSAAGQVAPFAAAGMTWWIEALGWWRGGTRAAASRIEDGPSAAASGALPRSRGRGRRAPVEFDIRAGENIRRAAHHLRGHGPAALRPS